MPGQEARAALLPSAFEPAASATDTAADAEEELLSTSPLRLLQVLSCFYTSTANIQLDRHVCTLVSPQLYTRLDKGLPLFRAWVLVESPSMVCVP